MGAVPAAKISVEEYLARDRVAEVPSEYHDGEMFPLAAISVDHSAISVNITSMLREPAAKSLELARVTEREVISASGRCTPTDFAKWRC